MASSSVELHLRPDSAIKRGLTDHGYWKGRLPRSTLGSQDWKRLVEASDHLSRDAYVEDVDRYRSLDRYTLHRLDSARARLELVSTLAPYVQSPIYNPEFGAVARHYEGSAVLSIRDSVLAEIFCTITPALFALFETSVIQIQVHHVRYAASVNRPARNSPPGYHKDGEPFISVHLLARRCVRGGANSLTDNEGRELTRFTLRAPGDCYLIDDGAVWHIVEEMTVSPGAVVGTRDILLMDYLPGSSPV